MKKYEIKYGLGGGFGGCGDWEVIEADSLEEAETMAYEKALEEYDSYAGSQGILSEEEIAEENPEWGTDEVFQAYREEAESWIEYEAQPVMP
jgi:hypothetical protein